MRWFSPAPPATKTTSAARSKPSKPCGSSSRSCRVQDRPRHFQRLLRAPARRARGHQFRLPLLRHQSRSRPRHRQRRKARTLRLHPRRGAPLAEALLFNTPPDGAAPADWRQQTREQRAAINQLHIAAITSTSAPAASRAKKEASTSLSTSACRATSSKAPRTASSPTSTSSSPRSRPARHHQRPAHGRHERSRPPVQRQRAHRRRSAAIRRGHEGRRQPPRAIHGEGGHRSPAAKIVLATVKGDVHDIGKNLVEIILANNGYNVINLGIKVPPEELIQAFHEHQPDAIGLSGLLVKSAQQMVDHRGRSQGRRHQSARCWSAARRSPSASPT